MRKYIIVIVICMFFLLSGCPLSHYSGGKSPIEIEQYENPMIWKEVLQIQVTLWPLEKKVNEMQKNVNEMQKNVNEIQKNVNEMRDELATTKLSSIQANKNIESLQAEIQQIKSESIRKEKTSVELPIGINDKKEMLKIVTPKVTGESKKTGPDIQSIIITDIQYYKVTDTQDRVLIYVNAMNNPKLQTLKGENPRIVLDFLNTRNIEKEKYEINTDGNFIKRIRISSYKEPMQKVRVVFDMIPNKKYSLDQKFSKKENIYSFDIKGK
jgi:TolA-binding protein